MMQVINRRAAALPGDISGQMKPQNLAQAAGQFEALFLRAMLKEMRKAADVLGEGSPFNSRQQQLMRDFYDDTLAQQLASQQSTGIARMIIQQLAPQGDAALKDGDAMVALQQQPQHLNPPVVPVLRRAKE
ncbi:peptidoglycan hydrolase [Pluralibacter gergoviae]|uniref:rod-binding protein n=1 Tax=Pluralibacter gergoviae TaxID=61647 RepID=UPI0005EC2129|nr:rod-binding protein [Pluralibacter gergoviae]KJM59189.1 peptidoglycan hydrolase [Pluralibacter gergoviae]OUQ99717.1 peptidoglycan hydrolase [Pluralibacter gergoviae]